MTRTQEPIEAVIARARAAYARTIIRARFESRCGRCGHTIDVGEPIAWRPKSVPMHASCFTGDVREAGT